MLDKNSVKKIIIKWIVETDHKIALLQSSDMDETQKLNKIKKIKLHPKMRDFAKNDSYLIHFKSGAEQGIPIVLFWINLAIKFHEATHIERKEKTSVKKKLITCKKQIEGALEAFKTLNMEPLQELCHILDDIDKLILVSASKRYNILKTVEWDLKYLNDLNLNGILAQDKRDTIKQCIDFIFSDINDIKWFFHPLHDSNTTAEFPLYYPNKPKMIFSEGTGFIPINNAYKAIHIKVKNKDKMRNDITSILNELIDSL